MRSYSRAAASSQPPVFVTLRYISPKVELSIIYMQILCQIIYFSRFSTNHIIHCNIINYMFISKQKRFSYENKIRHCILFYTIKVDDMYKLSTFMHSEYIPKRQVYRPVRRRAVRGAYGKVTQAAHSDAFSIRHPRGCLKSRLLFRQPSPALR